MQHPRTAFGEILGHPSKPNLRFFTDPAGGGGGGGTPTPTPPAPTPTPPAEDEPLSAEDAKALRKTADKQMRERNEARDALKPWTDLGITPEEAKQLKADRDAKNGGPTPEQIQKDADKRAETAAKERFDGAARTSAVRATAAELGFHNPAAALALIPAADLAKVVVSDDYEADPAAIKALLTALAKAEPYLVKDPTPGTVDYRAAGIGGTGGPGKPDPGPGTPRMAGYYATTPGK